MTSVRMLLFDVDGTLIRTDGVGVNSFNQGFSDVFGWEGALHGISPAGMTDLGIVSNVARQRCGRELTPEETAAVFTRYLLHLEENLRTAAGFRVLPGIREFLEPWTNDPRILLGLGTGNLERGARLKLERGDLNRFFRFGGFGSDSSDRAELLRKGKQRGERLLGRSLRPEQVVIVGDTPRDVLAGQAIGARTLAVATGPFSVEQLRASGADGVVSSFAEKAEVQRILDVGASLVNKFRRAGEKDG